MFKTVIIRVPDEQATRHTQYIAMLQCNRGHAYAIVAGATEREARCKLNRVKANGIEMPQN